MKQTGLIKMALTDFVVPSCTPDRRNFSINLETLETEIEMHLLFQQIFI